MKILLLADIHANWPALNAISETCDHCVFLGDAVDYATNPAPCIEWCMDRVDTCVRGNHDHSVAQRVVVSPGGMFRRLAAGMRPVHYERLNDDHLTWLAEMPVTQHVTLGNHSFLFVHATPRDPMDEYIANGRMGEPAPDLQFLKEQWQFRLEHVDVDFVCVGHTHVPMDLQLDGCRVLNPGSVGQPRDGDWRASYAIIEDGEVTFHRVEYDVEETIRDMQTAGVSEEIVEKASLVLKSGGNPHHAGK